MSKNREVTFLNPPISHGGPGSFQERFEKSLKKKGWNITYKNTYHDPSVIFIIGGTKDLFWLLSLKLKGKNIVQRLDGLNWQHKVKWPGLKIWLKSELREFLVRFVRRFIAQTLVYQTNFISNWWNEKYGPTNKNAFIVRNAVDLNEFNYNSNSKNDFEIVCVEGSIRGEPAYYILESIKSWRVNVYGDADKNKINYFKKKGLKNIKFFGSIPRKQIPKVLKRGRIFLNLEIIPPCPNSVIEAMAMGLPIVSFDTGSMRELIGEDAGLLIPYVSNPWKLENPSTKDLEKTIKSIFSNYNYYSRNARKRAELFFELETMTDKYIQIFNAIR